MDAKQIAKQLSAEQRRALCVTDLQYVTLSTAKAMVRRGLWSNVTHWPDLLHDPEGVTPLGREVRALLTPTESGANND